MSRSQTRDCMRSASMLALHDLDARLAPLDRYGLPGVSSAVVAGLGALWRLDVDGGSVSFLLTTIISSASSNSWPPTDTDSAV